MAASPPSRKYPRGLLSSRKKGKRSVNEEYPEGLGEEVALLWTDMRDHWKTLFAIKIIGRQCLNNPESMPPLFLVMPVMPHVALFLECELDAAAYCKKISNTMLGITSSGTGSESPKAMRMMV